EEASITGREEGGKLWRVPFNQIDALEVRKVSAGKTVGLGLGVLAAIWIAAALVLYVGLKGASSD
ncbi:MAG TPA: hypothetical protein VGE51_11445, partial [Fontimonas sp.]